MKPRDFWHIFFTVAAITALFVFLVTLIFYLIAGEKFFYILRVMMYLGIPFVLLNSFVGAFCMKSVTISMTFHDKKAFLSRLNIVLAEIGYYPESQIENFFTYKPSFQAGRLAGRISVQIDDNSIIMVGPNTYIKKLQKWLEVGSVA